MVPEHCDIPENCLAEEIGRSNAILPTSFLIKDLGIGLFRSNWPLRGNSPVVTSSSITVAMLTVLLTDTALLTDTWKKCGSYLTSFAVNVDPLTIAVNAISCEVQV